VNTQESDWFADAYAFDAIARKTLYFAGCADLKNSFLFEAQQGRG
jgi:hypothetical protein